MTMMNIVIKIKPNDVKENDPGAALDRKIIKVLIRRYNSSWLVSDKKELVKDTFRGQIIYERKTTHE